MSHQVRCSEFLKKEVLYVKDTQPQRCEGNADPSYMGPLDIHQGSRMKKARPAAQCWVCTAWIRPASILSNLQNCLKLPYDLVIPLLSVLKRDGNTRPRKNFCVNVHSSINLTVKSRNKPYLN